MGALISVLISEGWGGCVSFIICCRFFVNGHESAAIGMVCDSLYLLFASNSSNNFCFAKTSIAIKISSHGQSADLAADQH